MQKWETHMHTFNGSSCAKVRTFRAAKLYQKAGYDGVVLTNHFNYPNFRSYYGGKDEAKWIRRYLKEFFAFRKHCARRGIKALLGLELSLCDMEKKKGKKEYAEILVYGITPEQLRKYGLRFLALSQEEFFDFCRQNGWIMGQSHPFREHVIPLDFSKMDFLEAFNGHKGHQNRNELAEQTAQKFNLPQTGSSDFHKPGMETCGMLFPDDMKIETEADFVRAVLSRKGSIIRNDR